MLFDLASGDALFISEPGPLAENVTWLMPEGIVGVDDALWEND
ncbi:putative tail fiber assembly protein [Escherichia coli]|jgi:hypothetical protein|nr:putative tail fiber assembly protein [Escherichia coli]SQO73151.1 putative tail fiber assembly protein [Escherichia coli]SQO74722.1 putative tail fiber assembly protein [Escherichia coli]